MYEIFNSSGSDVKSVSDLLLVGMIELFRVTEADDLLPFMTWTRIPLASHSRHLNTTPNPTPILTPILTNISTT